MNRLFNKELILVSLAGTIVVMGMGFILPLFPIYISEKGASNFQLGLIISGFTISQFLVQPFFGGFSDRFGRRPFMIGGLACYGMVASLYLFAQNLWHIFLIRLLHGLGGGMIWPAMTAYVVDRSPMEKRGEIMSLLSGIEMLGFAVGPFLGGLLFGLGGMNLTFLSFSLLAFLAATVIWSLASENLSEIKRTQRSWVERYGFAGLGVRDIRLLCLIGLTECFAWGTLTTLLPVMASGLGISPAKIGWLFSIYFVVFILCQKPVGKWSDRQGRKKPILLGMIVYMMAVLILSQGGTLLHLMIVLAIAGAGLGIYSPSVRVAMADLSLEEIRGASMGLFFTTRMIGFFLGPNVSGLVADHWGVRIPFLISAALLGVGVWASSSLSPRLQRVQTFSAGAAKERKDLNL